MLLGSPLGMSGGLVRRCVLLSTSRVVRKDMKDWGVVSGG